MKRLDENHTKNMKRLVGFYQNKMKERRGGSFFIPIYRGLKLKTMWGRSKEELTSFLKGKKNEYPKLKFDYLIELV